MRVLVYNDLHLKPAGSDYDVSALAVPEDVDAVWIAGDLTHREGEDDVALAARFVEQFPSDIPVLYVPGNHDPAPMPDHVVDGVERAVSGHNVVRGYESVTVVGWGCEQRSLDPPLNQGAFPALDPRTAPRDERRYAADKTADAIEDALYDVVTCEATARDAAAMLDVADENLPAFSESVATVTETYEHLAGLVGDRSNVVLVSHLSPFNTSFDRHHSTGTREVDLEAFHTGSIALKLLARTHDVFAIYSGHSHDFGYETGASESGAPHMLNLGFRGIGLLDVDPSAGVFSFVDANVD